MKLYYATGACSLATRISLHEAGIPAEFERVDLGTKVTENGDDFTTINPKGYVPTLVLDDGSTLTENVAILDLIANREPKLGLEGPLGRTRLIEMLAYLSAEVHVAFKPLFGNPGEADRTAATQAVTKRLDFLEGQISDLYLLGPRFTVADAYLFVMLRWAKGFQLPLSARLLDYFQRVSEQATVRQALAEEA